MTQAVLNVEGMSCQHCVKAIEQSLAQLGGVTATINLDRAQVTVDFDAQHVSLDAITNAIEDAGYEVWA